MDGRCGLCPQRAVTFWWLADWRLDRSLCAHHAHDRGPRMLNTGWRLVRDERVTAPRPSLGPVTADPATH